MRMVKTSITLTRAEVVEIVERFQELLQEPAISITLFFDPDRFTTSHWWNDNPDVHPFIAASNDSVES